MRFQPWVVIIPVLKRSTKMVDQMDSSSFYLHPWTSESSSKTYVSSERTRICTTPIARLENVEKKKDCELLNHLHILVPQEYHEIMTTNYEVFCKRRVMDEGWFISLRLPNVEITIRGKD